MDKEFSLYIRRCHVCDALNEDAGLPLEATKNGFEEDPHAVFNFPPQPPMKCGQCGKFLAPFIFSDPELVKKQLDKHASQPPEVHGLPHLHPVQNAIYPPLIGLAIYW